MLIPFSKNLFYKVLPRDPKSFKDKLVASSPLSTKANSILYHVERVDSKCLYLIPVTYAHFLYSQKHPEQLKVYPLGISGICTYSNHLLLGKRSLGVSTYPNFWECVPSGSFQEKSVSYKEIKKGLLKEFKEETTLPISSIERVKPLYIFYDNNTRVYDLTFSIQLKPHSLKDLKANKEYSRFKWVHTKDISSLLKEKVVPLSRLLINLRGKS